MSSRSIRLCAVAALAFAASAQAQVLYNQNFDVDPTASWTFNSAIAGDTANDNAGNEANFFFDYSTVGIVMPMDLASIMAEKPTDQATAAETTAKFREAVRVKA